MLLAKDYFYFYNDDCDEDFEAFYVAQFRINGTLEHTYKPPMTTVFLYSELRFCGDLDGLHFLIHPYEGGRKTYLFREGKFSLVNESKDLKSDYLKNTTLINQKSQSCGLVVNFTLFISFKSLICSMLIANPQIKN